MAEKELSKMLMSRLKPFGHLQRIENMVGSGMPDVSYCIEGHEGFIENKWRDRWPARATDVVTLDHFTPQQRIWIRSRCAAKGKVWVMLEVEKPMVSYFLLPGLWAAQALGKTATRLDIETFATVKSRDGAFPLDSLLGALRYW